MIDPALTIEQRETDENSESFLQIVKGTRNICFTAKPNSGSKAAFRHGRYAWHQRQQANLLLNCFIFKVMQAIHFSI